jgi:DNA repair exonuclease SbcCD ATPase subunit
LIASLLVPREVFLSTIYFSQQVKDFFTSLKDSQQKEIFNNIFQLNTYKIKYGKVFDKIKELTIGFNNIEPDRIKQQSTLDSTIENLKGLEFTYNTWIKVRENKLNSFKTDVELKQNEIKQLQEVKSSLKYDEKELDEVCEKLTHYKSRLYEINSSIEKLQAELDEKLEDIEHFAKNEYETTLALGISLLNDEFALKKAEVDCEVNRLSEQQETLSTNLNKEILKLRNELEDKTKDLKEVLKELNDKKQTLDDDLNRINTDQRTLQNLELEFEK